MSEQATHNPLPETKPTYRSINDRILGNIKPMNLRYLAVLGMLISGVGVGIACEVRQFYYGMGVNGFILYAFSAYGILLTYNEAREIRDGFFGLYDGLPDWHDFQREQVHRWGQVRSPLGRIRHLPMIESTSRDIRSKAERQAINSPVQGTLSDLCIWSVAEVERVYGHTELQIVGMTHDSILGYAPEDQAEEMAVGVREVMENLPIRKVFGWEHQIPFPVDCEMSTDTLADLEKLTA